MSSCCGRRSGRGRWGCGRSGKDRDRDRGWGWWSRGSGAFDRSDRDVTTPTFLKGFCGHRDRFVVDKHDRALVTVSIQYIVMLADVEIRGARRKFLESQHG